MDTPLFNWKRFWYPRGSDLNLSDGGYLPDPDSRLGRIHNPEVKPLESICGDKCLVLLGDPGMGKSTLLLEQQRSREKGTAATTDHYLFRNLRSFQTDVRLSTAIFQDTVFQDWLKGTYNLHLFLDSLDEGLLSINVLASLLVDEFKDLPIDRFYLRIACRTAEFPSILETGLLEQWGKETVEFYVLAPLRRRDVEEAAKSCSLVPDVFLNEIENKSVVPLAIKPVTLKFLLSTYSKHGSFASSQADLYLEGCRLLAGETSQSRIAARQVGQLTADQRLMVAARIAAVTIFANRNSLFTDINNSTAASEEDVMIRDLVGGNETIASSVLQVEEKEIKNTLSSGLFSTRGSDRIGWAHQTYAEYLAAWYLTQHGLTTAQIVSLITHPYDPDGKMVPQLSETVAWLAVMVPEIFQNLIRKEPDLLLRSNVATGDAQGRAALVRAILRLYEQELLPDRDREQYKNLEHPHLSDQLLPFIQDKSKGQLVRRVAVDIAEACNLSSVNDALVSIALDPTELLACRVNAAYAIGRIGDQQSKAKLKPLTEADMDDPDDQLKGCALRALWPHAIKSDELFSLLMPPKREHFLGAYALFLSSELAPHLQVEDLFPALKFIANLKQSRNEMSSSLESLMDGIIKQAWENLDAPGIPEALAKALVLRLKHHDDLIKGRLESQDHLIFGENDHKRHQLLKTIFPVLAQESDVDVVWLIFSSTPLILSHDFHLLISHLNNNQSVEVQTLLVRAIERLFDGTKPIHLETIWDASKDNDVLSKAFKWVWQAIDLNSQEAKQMKESHEERQE